MIHLLCPNPALDRTLLVEEYEAGASNRPVEVKDFPGGKSFNVAYAIQKSNLNTPFTIHTLLGGYFGEYVEHLGQKNNYPLTITRLNTNTRICSIITNINTHEVYPLYEKGNKINKKYVEIYTQNLLNSVEDGDVIALSGSFLPGFSPNFFHILYKELKEKNITFCVDTSGEHLKQAFQLNPQLIKINDEELLDIFPDFQGESVEDYIHFFKENRKRLSKYFIVTIGKNGVIAKMDNDFYHLVSQPIKAKNPIASGDFFFGTLIANIINNEPVEDTLVAAISASTANCLNWYPEFTGNQFNTIQNTHITVRRF